MNLKKDLVTQSEAARTLGVSRQYLHWLIGSGRLPFVAVGTTRMVRRSEMDRFLLTQQSPSAKAPPGD